MTMRNEVLDTLKKARELITKPKNWTQGAEARNHRGGPVGWDSEDACSFCAYGAIHHSVIRGNVAKNTCDTLGRTTLYLDGMGVANYNDSHTHDEVLAAFDMTIARLESEYAKEVTWLPNV